MLFINNTTMARSECFCERSSCESIIIKNEIGEYVQDTNRRFRFLKDENDVIYDGGIVENDILNCEMKVRIKYRDKEGIHEPKNDYSDKGGHLERSLANDHRRKGHKEHQKKKNRKY
jgi:hypothetical protein